MHVYAKYKSYSSIDIGVMNNFCNLIMDFET